MMTIYYDVRPYYSDTKRITTKSGKVYLHHKGPDYGDKSDAVLVDAKHMSNAWENDGDAIKVNGRKT